MDIKGLIKRCKEHMRILDNYYIPEEERLKNLYIFLEEVIAFEYQQIEILDNSLQSVFDVLCKDLIRQSKLFINSRSQNIEDGKKLLTLIISVESYLADIDKKPWILGRKLSWGEKSNIKRIFLRKLHDSYDAKNNRSVRGTKVTVILSGSLAKGSSDWKLINGGAIPKPSDYDIPREYRKPNSIYKKLDQELNVPYALKPKMSDVDILIISEVIFDSIDKAYSENGWSFRLGEKYPTGVGASDILTKIHQSLNNTKIGGIKGRWVNYAVLRDKDDYNYYLEQRLKAINKLEVRIGKKIKIQDILILDQVIK
jgi:hypothetical protein